MVCAIGGTDPDELRQYELEEAPGIVCATPGKAKDMLIHHLIDSTTLKAVVVDYLEQYSTGTKHAYSMDKQMHDIA